MRSFVCITRCVSQTFIFIYFCVKPPRIIIPTGGSYLARRTNRFAKPMFEVTKNPNPFEDFLHFLFIILISFGNDDTATDARDRKNNARGNG